MKKLVLYGAGGFAREMVFMIERINREKPTYEFLGFIVDEEYYKPGETVHGYPVLGTGEWLLAHKDEVVCTCVIGDVPAARERIQEYYEGQGVHFETLISPDVEVHPSNKIGDGCILCRGVTLTVDIEIGKGTLIGERSGLGHDVRVGNYCVALGAVGFNGFVKVGNRVVMGGRAYFVPHVKVGDDAVVAAGSIVFTHVKPGVHVWGNPAHKIDI